MASQRKSLAASLAASSFASTPIGDAVSQLMLMRRGASHSSLFRLWESARDSTKARGRSPADDAVIRAVRKKSIQLAPATWQASRRVRGDVLEEQMAAAISSPESSSDEEIGRAFELAPSCPGDARLPSQRPGAWQTPRIIGELIAQDKLGRLHGGIIENVPDMIDDDPESPWGSDPARSIARGRTRGDRATFTPDAARRSRRSRRSSTCSSSRPRSWRTSASPTGASARWSSSGARTEDRGPSATSENPPNLVTRGAVDAVGCPAQAYCR